MKFKTETVTTILNSKEMFDAILTAYNIFRNDMPEADVCGEHFGHFEGVAVLFDDERYVSLYLNDDDELTIKAAT